MNDNPLLGSWHLVRWQIAYDDARVPTYPFGASARGLIVYAQDGWMSACIARADRPRLSSESVRSAPIDERLAAFESWFGYAGRYELRQRDDGALEVVHRVVHALNPSFVGTEQVRRVELDGSGGLTLSATDTLPGTTIERRHRLQWQRRDPSARHG